ncbi:MAG: cyclic nucleotide-binding domain-containing protein [Chloroflexota bacterium]
MINSSTLAGFPLFKDVSPEVLGKIASISEELSFNEGDIIFREGEKADKLHFLLSGGIALRVKIMTKPESVTVSFVSKSNECFGWSGLISPHHYTASAFCEENSTIMTLEGQKLLNILSENPEAGFKVMHRMANLVSDRLRNSRQALIKTM